MMAELPKMYKTQQHKQYNIEVYVDNFMALVIPTSKEEVTHVGQAVMHGIHDVFPEHKNDTTDPIAKNKLFKGKGQMSTTKTLLGFWFQWQGQNNVAGDSKTRSTPNHIAQLDPHVRAQRARDTIQRIQIGSGKNTTRIYSSASWSRATFTMQCSTTKKIRYCIPPTNRITQTSITPVQDAPPKINHATN